MMPLVLYTTYVHDFMLTYSRTGDIYRISTIVLIGFLVVGTGGET